MKTHLKSVECHTQFRHCQIIQFHNHLFFRNRRLNKFPFCKWIHWFCIACQDWSTRKKGRSRNCNRNTAINTVIFWFFWKYINCKVTLWENQCIVKGLCYLKCTRAFHLFRHSKNVQHSTNCLKYANLAFVETEPSMPMSMFLTSIMDNLSKNNVNFKVHCYQIFNLKKGIHEAPKCFASFKTDVLFVKNQVCLASIQLSVHPWHMPCWFSMWSK